MSVQPAPGALPPDYFERIAAVESSHWWHRGMRELSVALLGERWSQAEALLDAGCGTGGFLRWALDRHRFRVACGADLSEEAIARAKEQLPDLELRVAPLSELPFEDGSFDLVTANDVLQHVPAGELGQSFAELRRVLRPGGALLARTGGARRGRSEREDWRLYDRGSLRAQLESAGLRCERLTHANVLPSLLASARGRGPKPPTDTSHGIPQAEEGIRGRLGYRLLRAEAAYLAAPGRALPYGHTLLAVASRT
jgi:SAM-dependent methyltransferase